MFLTFHGKPRARPDVMTMSMNRPGHAGAALYTGAGALLAGIIFAAYFIGHDEAQFWAQSIFRGSENKIIEEIHHVGLGGMSPFVAMALGFALAYQFYIRRTDLPGKLAEQHCRSLSVLLNKWYFDDSTTFCRQSGQVAGTLPVEEGRWLADDGFGLTASRPGSSMSPRESCGCRPAICSTMPSPC